MSPFFASGNYAVKIAGAAMSLVAACGSANAFSVSDVTMPNSGNYSTIAVYHEGVDTRSSADWRRAPSSEALWLRHITATAAPTMAAPTMPEATTPAAGVRNGRLMDGVVSGCAESCGKRRVYCRVSINAPVPMRPWIFPMAVVSPVLLSRTK
jgi:hypothetical protein